MRVQDIMTKSVRTVAPSMAAADAWELMKTRGIHHLVVTRGADVVGVLSNRDAGGRADSTTRAGRTVGDLMTTAVVTVTPEQTARKAATLMKGRTIGCLPVKRGGRLVGIVTTSDLLRLLGHGVDRPSHQERRTLNTKVPHRKQHRAGKAW
jgi:acetoin utilization protein AcuB